MADKKLIKEEGFVLGREIKEATEEFVSRDGKTVPAHQKNTSYGVFFILKKCK